MTKPDVLMLDEPTAGVSPIVMDELFDRIIEVARTGISILMVEQNARQALEIADMGYVLVQGRNRFTDTGRRCWRTPRCAAAFWGADTMFHVAIPPDPDAGGIAPASPQAPGRVPTRCSAARRQSPFGLPPGPATAPGGGMPRRRSGKFRPGHGEAG
jgi:energy-coupling factor transporter ATP-binding protein EcfA2